MAEKLKTVSTRVSGDYYEMISEDAESMGLSISEWLYNAIDDYLDMENLGCLDLLFKDFYELEELIDQYNLDVDPDDYGVGLGTSRKVRTDDLREAIAQVTETDMSDEAIWESLCEQDRSYLEKTCDFLDVGYESEDSDSYLMVKITEELDIEIPEPGEEEEEIDLDRYFRKRKY